LLTYIKVSLLPFLQVFFEINVITNEYKVLFHYVDQL